MIITSIFITIELILTALGVTYLLKTIKFKNNMQKYGVYGMYSFIILNLIYWIYFIWLANAYPTESVNYITNKIFHLSF